MKLIENWRSRRWAGAAILAGVLVLTPGCSFGGDLVSYELPAESAPYTLEVETDGVTTTWEYTSARPEEDQADQTCLADALGNPDAPPCAPEPLIFLRYDLALELDDTATAGRPHEITVTGYYQPQPGELPTVTDLGVEASFDGGQSWQDVRTEDIGEGAYRAVVPHPKLARTEGVVSLRVNASDDAGNTVTQTIPHAYGLR